ncbi:unnamed protein product [Mucor hiemalis]
MRKRNIPCTECRHLQRKCTFTPDSFDCVQCAKLQKICIQTPKTDLEQDCDLENDKAEVQQLTDTVESLEWIIAQLEAEMDRLRNNDSKALTKIEYKDSSQEILEAIVKNLTFQWKVQIENGTFQIDTGIKSTHDLLQYYLNSIQYLSPISNMVGVEGNPKLSRQVGCTDSIWTTSKRWKLTTSLYRKTTHPLLKEGLQDT